MWSIDNRRLYCLREYQKLVEPRQVVIRVRLHKWHRQFDCLLDHESTPNDGTSIRVIYIYIYINTWVGIKSVDVHTMGSLVQKLRIFCE